MFFIAGKFLEVDIAIGFSGVKTTKTPPAVIGQPIDPQTGLSYQKVSCSEKSGVLIKLHSKDPPGTLMEIYLHVDFFPTKEEYTYFKEVATVDNPQGGSVAQLILTKKDVRIPRQTKECYLGARNSPGETSGELQVVSVCLRPVFQWTRQQVFS